MRRLWLVTNPASGSAARVDAEQLAAALQERGIEIVGRTTMFEEGLPSIEALDQGGCDGVLVLAGDGTINAVACALDQWRGSCIVLPGGTMNMLAKALHGPRTWSDIVSALSAEAGHVTLPYVEINGRRAFVAVIAGPAAAWVHPREAIRDHRFHSLGRAITLAWRRTFGPGVRLIDQPGAHLQHRAVIVSPLTKSLEIAIFDTSRLGEMIKLGWRWLVGEWRRAPGVTTFCAPSATLASRRPVAALVDGEEAMLESPALFTHGVTRLRFLSVKPN